jgi:hypothetical protein
MPVLHIKDSESLSLPTLSASQEPGWTVTPVDKDGNPTTNPNERWYHPETGRLMQKGVTQALMFALPNSALLRSPTASQGQGGALGETEARKRGNTVGIRDQAMDLAKLQGHKVSREAANKVSVPTPTASDASFDKPGLMRQVTRLSPNRGVGLPLWANRIATDFYLPTPNTMEHREVKTPEQIAALKAKSLGGYRNLREAVINELFPTPITSDYKNGKSSAGYGLNLPETAKSLMPTPTTRDYKDGSQPHERDGKVQTDTVARAILNSGEVLLGTPRANAANSSSKQVEAGAPKSRIEDQVLTTNWGKFEPAIRRWESIIGRPAPEPTKPDGKDGNHRLSSKFTEWMMGLPDGWITGHDLKRNDELKLAGNGVVPQQAELALRLLLELPEER